MEEQDSILLQKKMVLILFTIMFFVASSFYATKFELESVKGYRVASLDAAVENGNNVIENDNVLIEQVSYAAMEEISANAGNDASDTDSMIASVDNLEDKIEGVEIEKRRIKENIVVSRKGSREERKSLSDDVSMNLSERIESEDLANDNVEQVNGENSNYSSYKELSTKNPPSEYKDVMEVSATAYCLCKKCCGKSPSNPNYGMTASGYKIVPGTGAKVIAVDTNIVSLGTNVYVEGLNGAWDYGYAFAGDTGSAIKNYKIDLYMDTHEEALSWGRRKVNLYILGE